MFFWESTNRLLKRPHFQELEEFSIYEERLEPARSLRSSAKNGAQWMVLRVLSKKAVAQNEVLSSFSLGLFIISDRSAHRTLRRLRSQIVN